MNIKINGENRFFPKPELSVEQLLVEVGVESPDVVTVQLNGEFLDRQLCPSTGLHENDEVEFLYFLGGGGV